MYKSKLVKPNKSKVFYEYDFQFDGAEFIMGFRMHTMREGCMHISRVGKIIIHYSNSLNIENNYNISVNEYHDAKLFNKDKFRHNINQCLYLFTIIMRSNNRYNTHIFNAKDVFNLMLATGKDATLCHTLGTYRFIA
jgi:hypothetical protein